MSIRSIKNQRKTEKISSATYISDVVFTYLHTRITIVQNLLNSRDLVIHLVNLIDLVDLVYLVYLATWVIWINLMDLVDLVQIALLCLVYLSIDTNQLS